MQNSLLFLVKTLSDLYLVTFVLRLILQRVGADFYNPVSQFVLRVSNPIVKRARRIVPSVGAIDLPTLASLIVLQCLVTWLLLALANVNFTGPVIAQYVFFRLINLTLWLYSICLIGYIVLSWIMAIQYNSSLRSLLGATDEIVAPVLRPVRRFLPMIGGLDLSPIPVFILIQAIEIALPLPLFLR